MDFYYLHLHSIKLFQQNTSSDTYIIDSLITDSMFQASGFWAFDDFPKEVLTDKSLKVESQIVDDIEVGANLKTKESSVVRRIPRFLYQLQFTGTPGVDHIGLYENTYLIVSEFALGMLRKSGVLVAEHDLIDGELKSYFDTNRQFFWMPENMRSKFIQQFHKGS